MNSYADGLPYDTIWDGYCAGMISTVRLTELMRRDEVFAAWCRRKVKAIRQRIEEANKSGELVSTGDEQWHS